MAAVSRVLLLLSTASAAGLCEPWCSNSCMELNGDTQLECSACLEPHLCRPGQPGYGRAAGSAPLADSSASQCEGAAEAASSTPPPRKTVAWPSAFVSEWQVGVCDLQKVHHSQVSRAMLEEAQAPFIIVGLTEGWHARTRWAKESLLRAHADEPYHLHASSNQSLGELLRWHGKYHMGHAVYPPEGCYSDPWRPYSPMLFGALAGDYKVPPYFTPMATFQMGVGSGRGIGVPPENHPASWFAAIHGRKRWVIMPPDAGTSRSGGPGSEPPEVMSRQNLKLCEPAFKPVGALHCDQQEGEVLWLPSFWWHETCGLDDFSIGLGGITYKGCCDDIVFEECTGESGSSYKISDIAACNSSARKCGTLPITEFE
ncbi:hypothetical protein AB1Y20_023628 [Prymnesium parvum]|uniref:JmjC domain-containing protein n=1 Tax=Prymnesium parvum TaxID=97485 RepID=A0AB34JFA3_PRYPA